MRNSYWRKVTTSPPSSCSPLNICFGEFEGPPGQYGRWHGEQQDKGEMWKSPPHFLQWDPPLNLGPFCEFPFHSKGPFHSQQERSGFNLVCFISLCTKPEINPLLLMMGMASEHLGCFAWHCLWCSGRLCDMTTIFQLA